MSLSTVMLEYYYVVHLFLYCYPIANCNPT